MINKKLAIIIGIFLIIIIAGSIFLFKYAKPTKQKTDLCFQDNMLSYYLALKNGSVDGCGLYLDDDRYIKKCKDNYNFENAIFTNNIDVCKEFQDVEEKDVLEKSCILIIRNDKKLCEGEENPFGEGNELCIKLIDYLNSDEIIIEDMTMDSNLKENFYKTKALVKKDISFCGLIESEKNIEKTKGLFDKKLLCKLTLSKNTDITYHSQVKNPCLPK